MPPSLASLANAKALARQQAQLGEKTEIELQVEVIGEVVLKLQTQLDKLSKGNVPIHPRDLRK